MLWGASPFRDPLILNKIQTHSAPIVDLLIGHFQILELIQKARGLYLEAIMETNLISKELLHLPYFSEMKNKLEVSSSGKFYEKNALELLEILQSELQDPKGSLEKQKELIDDLSQKHPKLFYSLLLLLKTKLCISGLDFPKLSLLVKAKPALLIDTFSGKGSSLLQIIETMKSFQKMEKAIVKLLKINEIIQYHQQHLPEIKNKNENPLSKERFEDLFQNINEVESFFSFTNDQLQQSENFLQENDSTPVSKKKAIMADRFIEPICLSSQKAMMNLHYAASSLKDPLINLPSVVSEVFGVSHPKHILMPCAEYTGVIKIGGLAEAVRGIAEGLKSKGYQVTLIMPKYSVFPNDQSKAVAKSLKLTPYEIQHPFGNSDKVDKVFLGKVNDIDVLFIEDTLSQTQNSIDHFSLDGNDLYSIPNDIDEQKLKERFAYFSQAIALLIPKLKEKIDAVFFHDWHGAAAIPLLTRNTTKDWVNGTIPPLVYVFHNNGYAAQGILDPKKHQSILQKMTLPVQVFNTTQEAVTVADHVCTVSESYALEVQDREGNGLQKAMRLAANRGMLTGITNGCNLSLFNPETDKQLSEWIDPLTNTPTPLNFGLESNIVGSKHAVKIQLQNWLKCYHPEIIKKYGVNLVNDNIIVVITRFDSSQKGLDKFRLAMRAAMEKGATFIAMGIKEDPRATEILDELEKEAAALKNPEKWGGAWIIRDSFNKMNKLNYQHGTEEGIPGIGSLIRAAANINFCPSEYEPCGLTHLEGFPFAQFTVATNLGGYADIICTEKENSLFNGFLFQRFKNWNSKEQDLAVQEAVGNAVDFWNSLGSPKKNELMRNLMQTSRQYSWTTSPKGLSPIEKYEKVIVAAQKSSKSRGVSRKLEPKLLSAISKEKNNE